MIEQVPEFVDEIVQNATEFMTHADHLPQPVEQLDFDQQIQQLEARNRTIGEEIREALRDSGNDPRYPQCAQTLIRKLHRGAT